MERMYLYKSHIGDVYWNTRELKRSELKCDLCGGVDEYLGAADTIDEFVKIINSSGAMFSMLFQNELLRSFGNYLTVQHTDGKIHVSPKTETKVE